MAESNGLPQNNPNNDEVAIGAQTYRGTNFLLYPSGGGNSINIKTSDFSHELEQGQFQADYQFRDVRYPYWQFPFNVGPFNQAVINAFSGAVPGQSNLGIVGRPRGIGDYDTPLTTPYGVPPDQLDTSS